MATGLLNDGVNMVLNHPSLSGGSEAQDETPAYDPSDHKIDAVKQHIEENPDQREAVLAAERDGKNRSTLVEWLEAPAGDGAEVHDKSEED